MLDKLTELLGPRMATLRSHFAFAGTGPCPSPGTAIQEFTWPEILRHATGEDRSRKAQDQLLFDPSRINQ